MRHQVSGIAADNVTSVDRLYAMPDDELIDVKDPHAVERWTEQFCCTRAELIEAVQAAGPRAEDVKRHLFRCLLRSRLNRPGK